MPIGKLAILVSENEFWKVFGLKIPKGPALRAMFKISAFITCFFVDAFDMVCRDGYKNRLRQPDKTILL